MINSKLAKAIPTTNGYKFSHVSDSGNFLFIRECKQHQTRSIMCIVSPSAISDGTYFHNLTNDISA